MKNRSCSLYRRDFSFYSFEEGKLTCIILYNQLLIIEIYILVRISNSLKSFYKNTANILICSFCRSFCKTGRSIPHPHHIKLIHSFHGSEHVSIPVGKDILQDGASSHEDRKIAGSIRCVTRQRQVVAGSIIPIAMLELVVQACPVEIPLQAVFSIQLSRNSITSSTIHCRQWGGAVMEQKSSPHLSFGSIPVFA